MHVCDVSPCVFVMRDTVGGRALPCPQQRRSEGSWQREHVQTCACKRGQLCGAHNKVGKDGPDLRVKGFIRVACVGKEYRAVKRRTTWCCPAYTLPPLQLPHHHITNPPSLPAHISIPPPQTKLSRPLNCKRCISTVMEFLQNISKNSTATN